MKCEGVICPRHFADYPLEVAKILKNVIIINTNEKVDMWIGLTKDTGLTASTVNPFEQRHQSIIASFKTVCRETGNAPDTEEVNC
jgi:hypothetical protein